MDGLSSKMRSTSRCCSASSSGCSTAPRSRHVRKSVDCPTMATKRVRMTSA
nr:hypothetical protein [Eggerthella sinensis]